MDRSNKPRPFPMAMSPKSPKLLKFKSKPAFDPIPAILKPNSTASRSKQTLTNATTCSGCHRAVIAPTDVLKTCQKFRDKDRAKQRRRAERERAGKGEVVIGMKSKEKKNATIGLDVDIRTEDLAKVASSHKHKREHDSEGMKPVPTGLKLRTTDSSKPNPASKAPSLPVATSCSRCNLLVIAPTDAFKTCQKCRRKDRAKKQRRAERERAALTGKGEPLRKEEEDTKPNIHVDIKSAHPLRLAVSPKREREDDSEAIYPTKRARPSDDAETSGDDAPVPYQTSTALINAIPAIPSKPGSRAVSFVGTYSIVKRPGVDHAHRVHKVFKELKRGVKGWAFSPIPSEKPVTISRYIHREHFPCTCSSSLPSSSTPSMKKSKTLTGYFSSPSQEKSSVGTCGGYVRITVSDDDSHWLAIDGQRVVVRVVHP